MSYPRTLRTHQQDAQNRAQQIVEGSITEPTTLALITPGGGKSLCYSVFSGRLLQAGYVNRVCLVVPRLSLVKQISDAFYNPYFNKKGVRKADNTAPLVRDTSRNIVGYVTTYQAIVSNPEVHRREFMTGEWLLVFDEVHHLGEEKAWSEAVRPLVELSKHLFCGSGTINRWGGDRIPYIRYGADSQPDSLKPIADITYGRVQALRDEVVTDYQFEHKDGFATYDFAGRRESVRVSEATGRRETQARNTILLTEGNWVRDALEKGFTSWLQLRQDVKYPFRMLVVAKDQDAARFVCQWVKSNHPRYRTVLAISDENYAHRDLAAFRDDGQGDILVTVAMAYEGLDVPDLKYILCLTNYRATSWLEQAFSRALRPDYQAIERGVPYHLQTAQILTPDDRAMRAITDEFTLEREQARALKVEDPPGPPGGEPGSPPSPSTFNPISAEPDRSEFSSAQTGNIRDERLNRYIENVRKIPGCEALRVKDIILMYNMAVAENPPPPPTAAEEAPTTQPEPPPAAGEEDLLRSQIDRITRRLDGTLFNQVWGTMNKELRRRFAKSREHMGLTELQEVLQFLRGYTRPPQSEAGISIDDERYAE